MDLAGMPTLGQPRTLLPRRGPSQEGDFWYRQRRPHTGLTGGQSDRLELWRPEAGRDLNSIQLRKNTNSRRPRKYPNSGLPSLTGGLALPVCNTLSERVAIRDLTQEQVKHREGILLTQT
jgi:hypothetical protein